MAYEVGQSHRLHPWISHTAVINARWMHKMLLRLLFLNISQRIYYYIGHIRIQNTLYSLPTSFSPIHSPHNLLPRTNKDVVEWTSRERTAELSLRTQPNKTLSMPQLLLQMTRMIMLYPSSLPRYSEFRVCHSIACIYQPSRVYDVAASS